MRSSRGSAARGIWAGGTAGGGGAFWAPGGNDKEVSAARSCVGGAGPVTGPLTATAAGFGTTFCGKLIAKKIKNKKNKRCAAKNGHVTRSNNIWPFLLSTEAGTYECILMPLI